jgi:hypothetical protein
MSFPLVLSKLKNSKKISKIYNHTKSNSHNNSSKNPVSLMTTPVIITTTTPTTTTIKLGRKILSINRPYQEYLLLTRLLLKNKLKKKRKAIITLQAAI